MTGKSKCPYGEVNFTISEKQVSSSVYLFNKWDQQKWLLKLVWKTLKPLALYSNRADEKSKFKSYTGPQCQQFKNQFKNQVHMNKKYFLVITYQCIKNVKCIYAQVFLCVIIKLDCSRYLN